MRESRIRRKLSRNQAVLVTTLHFTDASLYEMTSLMGFDGIWMDMEHHGYSLETATQLMRAARVGTADIVARPAKGEFMRLQRMLEAGAAAIMYPQCDNAAEAAELVHWAKFPPQGRRGCDGANPDAPYMMTPLPEYLCQANAQTVLVVQIENLAALNDVEAIARTPGIDVLFLGPGDLSIAMGLPGQTGHPHIQAATQRVAAAAREAGIHWGLPVGSAQQAADVLQLGARFICHQADILIVKQGLESLQAAFAPLGFTFGDA